MALKDCFVTGIRQNAGLLMTIQPFLTKDFLESLTFTLRLHALILPSGS